MKIQPLFLALVLATLCALASGAPLAAEPADPENTLYLDLDYGRVVIRMRPDLAPKHIERIKQLVRDGFYDGMLFHRVIAGFMAQTGDPRGNGTGGSGRTLAAEFTKTPQMRGTVAMARASDKNSGDSQFFIVLSDSHRADLDGKYTVWGDVTSGMEFVDMVRKGDAARDGKVSNPDHVVRMRIAADADAPRGEKLAAAEVLKRPAAAPMARNFSGGEFRCTVIADTAVEPALAALWAHGDVAGRLKAQNMLSMSAAAPAMDDALTAACASYPGALLPAVDRELAKSAHEIKDSVAGFSPAQMTCADYVAARTAAAPAGDFADLWAFSFIQGYKAVGQPDLEIPFEARPQILGALAGVCAKNPQSPLLDFTALVAAKVKLK